jgi:O-antigen/teichoic acid export membrane protein
MKLQLLSAFIFLAVSYAGAYLFVLLLFPKYVAAIPLLYILLLAALPNSVAALFTPIFSAFKEQKSLLFSNIVKLVLIVFLLPPAIYFFGFLGIGIELVLTTLGNTFERYARLKRILPEFSFRMREIVHPDNYEREVMRGLVRGIRSRIVGILPNAKNGI